MEFEDRTGYPLSQYYVDYTNFISSWYPEILLFYKGEKKEPNQSSFKELDRLIQESDKLANIVDNNKGVLSTGVDMWDLIVELEDMRFSLMSINNMGKWLRSTVSRNNYSRDMEVDAVLSQNQTIEGLMNVVGESNPDKWIDVANRNDVQEEDYTSDGGDIFKINLPSSNSIVIDDVVAIVRNDEIYGRDIKKVITYKDDDLECLSPKETVYQCIDILCQLRKGMVPEYPNMGYKSISGSNLRNLGFPSFFRQLQHTLQTDAIVKAVATNKIDRSGDNVILSVSISTKLTKDIIKEVFV